MDGRPAVLGKAFRLRWLLAVALVTAMAQLPVVHSAATTQHATRRAPGWSVPPAPDLAKCGFHLGRQDRSCRKLLEDHGREVAKRIALARGHAARLPLAASPAATTFKCPPNAFPGAVCGRVDVPLDRAHPGRGTIGIRFELYKHTNPGPAESAILVNFGGPGGGTIPGRGGAFFLFGGNLKAHDLLLVDDRGRGLSEAIDCPRAQGQVGTIPQQVAQCAGILGAAASRYGSGEVAKDTDDVRAALGYDLVDYYGVSYGGADITAYATRFPEHIRSLVLDAPWGDTPMREELVAAQQFVGPSLDVIRLLCRRSPTCRSERPHPARDFAGLVERVRRNPVVGNAYTADGARRHVRITPRFVIEYLMLPTGPFTSNGEIAAAAVALRHGDPQPLLRLAAETYYPICCLEPPGNYFPPRFFSAGSYLATYCVDNEWEWDWDSSLPQRRAEHAAALRAAPAEMFAPFTAAEATNSTFISKPQCIHWPEPEDPSPIAPSNPEYPDVPTFVLGGDLDNVVPLQQTRWIAELFPGSRLVEVAGAGHGAAFTTCGARLVRRFVASLELGDTTCANRPEQVYPSVGEFPRRAQAATPAAIDPGHGNQVGRSKLRVAAVAAATVKDAIARADLAFFGPGKVVGRGLRGGRIVFEFKGRSGSNWVIRLQGVRFANDVVVDGVVHWPPSPRVRADLEISGTARGTLSVRTNAYLERAMFKVRGQLGGRHVAALVPQA